MFEPAILAGTVVGVLLNIWLPEWVLLSLLIITLVYNTYLTARKGHSMFKQEIAEESQKIFEYEMKQSHELTQQPDNDNVIDTHASDNKSNSHYIHEDKSKSESLLVKDNAKGDGGEDSKINLLENGHEKQKQEWTPE
eukprot:CAMPEP_0116921444 /NCGR_PEP_ID=MMETSP0467-20121206/21633_1 /TAXON_ID=283647 /ORGANISM="Mesodinium pulex, Strain SPMC105" /LENGTH=137 /DNA_ID=CAMNT_0004599511 /DNA_START=548 /DNA_END=961 /DNA_ORIENTATION=-